MNVNSSYRRTRERGITLVEILIAISVLVILVAFALPSAGTAAARAEMKAALENLEYSVGTARNVARLTESSISLHIETSPGDASPLIRFSGQDGRRAKSSPDIQEYQLPESIQLVADRDHFVFDPRGLVDEPGRILLVSVIDDELRATLDID
jgi:prepilin-type N-terminal cleavage/methylation domain-containing protein